tara:strand:- start:142 stop:915 length:774 start_codon:yes stop_codon:yes gene_type:complete
MKKIFLTISSIFIINTVFSQVIIDTESSLKKIDSTFHIFGDFSGITTRGNIKLQILNSSLTIGQRIDKNLYRFSFQSSLTKFNGNAFDNNISGQIRLNHYFKTNHSVYYFVQMGKSLRASIDSRSLAGAGLRNRILSKETNYLDFAYGPFYEIEKYPAYAYSGVDYSAFTKYNWRLSLNAFSNLKITDNVSLLTTVYSQWSLNGFEDIRLYLNSYLSYAITKNISIFLRYTSRSASIQYVKGKVNDSNILYGTKLTL